MPQLFQAKKSSFSFLPPPYHLYPLLYTPNSLPYLYHTLTIQPTPRKTHPNPPTRPHTHFPTVFTLFLSLHQNHKFQLRTQNFQTFSTKRAKKKKTICSKPQITHNSSHLPPERTATSRCHLHLSVTLWCHLRVVLMSLPITIGRSSYLTPPNRQTDRQTD